MTEESEFRFEISLSVLNHLGRNLYRSFGTMLGEAISNAWDADATAVHIQLAEDRRGFWIRDNGDGMDADDFQNKFLRLGYAKRQNGGHTSEKGRPYIGRKGIGKLALLSGAKRLTILSKKAGGAYIGGVIDNSGLDHAITEDLTPDEYPLEAIDISKYADITNDHEKGTILIFEDLRDGVKRSLDFLRKTVALYFRFSLVDEEFQIFLNGEPITHADLKDLADHTEFLWTIGDLHDPYVDELKETFSAEPEEHEIREANLDDATGFIASVRLPRQLKVLSTDERVGIDLFVNGRLREKGILRYVPTAQIPESYLYGQIHYNVLEGDLDRFTSSREGVVADDPVFLSFLEKFHKTILKVVEEWDDLRRKHREDGDPENTTISKKQRAAEGLYNTVLRDAVPDRKSPSGKTVDAWANDLRGDAAFNFESYAECFVSENMIRRFITEKGIPLSPEAKKEAEKWKTAEKNNKAKGNISIEIRSNPDDLGYLSMDGLANLVDKPKDKNKDAGLGRDATEFKPMRDAVAHTALLTDLAKTRLGTVRQNIRARVKTLLETFAKEGKKEG